MAKVAKEPTRNRWRVGQDNQPTSARPNNYNQTNRETLRGTWISTLNGPQNDNRRQEDQENSKKS